MERHPSAIPAGDVFGDGVNVAARRWAVRDVAPPARPAGATATAPTKDRQSIAVLPFDNLGGAPEEDQFSDGMTGDLITDLSPVYFAHSVRHRINDNIDAVLYAMARATELYPLEPFFYVQAEAMAYYFPGHYEKKRPTGRGG